MSLTNERCFLCGKDLPPNTPEEEAEALAEYHRIFGRDIPESEKTVVCDDCFKAVDPENHPRLVEQVVADFRRGQFESG